MARLTRRERCLEGRHTPKRPAADGDVRRGACRYCGAPIMRTGATRIWFAAGLMAGLPAGQILDC